VAVHTGIRRALLELFGSRAWLVAFCFFAQAAYGQGVAWAWSPVAIAAVANLFGPPASILATRWRFVSGAAA